MSWLQFTGERTPPHLAGNLLPRPEDPRTLDVMTTAPSTRPPTLAGQVITLHGTAELAARAGHLMRPATEFICAATDMSTWATLAAQTTAMEQATESSTHGVRLYKVF